MAKTNAQLRREIEHVFTSVNGSPMRNNLHSVLNGIVERLGASENSSQSGNSYGGSGDISSAINAIKALEKKFDSLFEKVLLGTRTEQTPILDEEGNEVLDEEGNPTFEETEVTDYAIKAKYGLFSVGFVSAYGTGEGVGGGSGTNVFLLREWDQWVNDGAGMEDFALSAKLGVELYKNSTTVAASLANINERLDFLTGKIDINWPDLTGRIEFNQLPTLYWADQPITENGTTDSTPTVARITIGGATLTWDADHQCLIADKGIVSESFVSAYGINDDANNGGGVELASQNWGDATYDSSHALPANLGYAKIEELRNRIDNIGQGEDITLSYDTIVAALGYTPLSRQDLTYENLPSMYIGTTKVQKESADQHLTGIASIAFSQAESVTPKIWYDNENHCLRTNVGFVSESFISAYGVGLGDGGGSTLIGNILEEWDDYTEDKAKWVLSAKLGVELHIAVEDLLVSHASLEERFNAAMFSISVSLADFDERLRALGIAIENAGEKLTFKTDGSGNAVTAVTKNGTEVVLKKDGTFLTQHQSLDSCFKKTDFSKANIKSTLGISDWALAASKPSYTKAEVGLGNVDNTADANKSVKYATSAGSATSASTATTANKLSVVSKTAWGRTYWTSGGVPTDVSGDLEKVGYIYFGSDKSHYIWYDSTNNCIRTNVGFVSSSFISAYGANGGDLNVPTATITTLNVGQSGTIKANSASSMSISAAGTLSVNYGSCTYEGVTTMAGGSFSVETSAINIGTSKTNGITIGRNGINTNVYGTIHFYGTAYLGANTQVTSDVRLKNVLRDTELNIKDIANAPSFIYSLKDDECGFSHIGTSAQYWKTILPEAVKEDVFGYLSLDYVGITMTACIALAKRSETHEERIARLEKENVELKNRIVELEKAKCL